MPPVQVPNIERFPVQDTPSVGRVEYKPIDVASGQAQQTAATEKLGSDIVSYEKHQELFTAEMAATAAANNYHKFKETALVGRDGLSSKTGEPSPYFQQYHKSADDFKKKLLDGVKDSSELVQSTVAAKLNKVDQKMFDRETTLHGTLQSNWETDTTNEAVKNQKDDMMQTTASIAGLGPNDYRPLDKNINDLKKTLLNYYTVQGRATFTYQKDEAGNIVKDEDGQPVRLYQADDAVKQRIKHEIDDGLSKAILNLSGSGNVQGAKLLAQKYGDENYFTSSTNEKLTKELRKDEIQQEGIKAYAQVKDLPFKEQREKLLAIQDPEVQLKALKELDSYRLKMDNQQKASDKDNFGIALKRIIDRKHSGNPFLTPNDANNDPVIRKAMKQVKDPKFQETLDKSVKRDDVSNEDDKAAFYEQKNSSEGLRAWTYEDFATATRNFSKADHDKAEIAWRKETSQNEIDAEYTKRTKEMSLQLRDSLFNLGYVKRNSYGKFNDMNQKLLNAAYDELTDKIQNMPANPSPVERKALVKELAAEIVKRKKMSGGFFSNIVNLFNGSSTPTTQAPTTTVAPAKGKSSSRVTPTTNVPTTTSAPGAGAELDDAAASRAFYRATREKYGEAGARIPNEDELKKFKKNGYKL